METGFSKLIEVELNSICHNYQVFVNNFEPTLPGKEQAIHKPHREKLIGVYASFFEFSNMRLPLRKFFMDILDYYKMHLCQLCPKGVLKMVSFEMLCAALNVIPTVPLFRRFFRLTPNGDWFTFSSRTHQNLLCDKKTKKLHNWTKRFFFVKIEDEMFMRKLGPVRDRMPKEGTYNEKDAEILNYYTFFVTPFAQELLWKTGLSDFRHEGDVEPTPRPPEIKASCLLDYIGYIEKKVSKKQGELKDEGSAQKIIDNELDNPREKQSQLDYTELWSLGDFEDQIDLGSEKNFWGSLFEQGDEHVREFNEWEQLVLEPMNMMDDTYTEDMEDANETLNKSNVPENQTVQSIRSDLTYTKDKSDLQQNVCDSNNQPIASIESCAAGAEKGRNGVNQDEQKLNHARDWIKSYHLDNFDVADALSAFPDISLVLIEEILNKLVNEGLLLKAGNNSFNIMRNLEYEFDAGIDENDGYVAPGNKSPLTTVEGLMYMKALYHALPMEYINISKLQSKLGREANQNTVRKLMDKMTKEGYIEASDNLEKRVLQSDLTKKKLAEVQKVLNMDAMEDANDTPNKSNVSENQTVQSIRSDLTYTKDKSDFQQNVYNSNNQPIASIESYAVGAEKGRNGVNQDDKMDTVVCSGQSTLSKRSRKASTVKDLILQYNMKRQKVNLV